MVTAIAPAGTLYDLPKIRLFHLDQHCGSDLIRSNDLGLRSHIHPNVWLVVLVDDIRERLWQHSTCKSSSDSHVHHVQIYTTCQGHLQNLIIKSCQFTFTNVHNFNIIGISKLKFSSANNPPFPFSYWIFTLGFMASEDLTFISIFKVLHIHPSFRQNHKTSQFKRLTTS